MARSKEATPINLVHGSLFLIILQVLWIDTRLAVRLAASMGTITLAILLIAPRLLKRARFKRWHTPLLTIAKNSKWMGIWTALWFLLHAVIAFVVHLKLSPQRLFEPQVILGFTALCTLIMILSISNSWSYQNIKWWKHLNMLVWFVVPLGLAHSLMASAYFLHSLPLQPALICFPLVLAVGLVAHFETQPGYFAPHRLALLLGGTATGILTAWWYFALY